MRARVMRAHDPVPEMAVHRVDEKRLAHLIPVMTPRIHRAVPDRLEHPPLRMIPPHAAEERHPLRIRRARHRHATGRGRAATPVEPAIWSPAQAVGEVMIILRGHREAIQHHLRRPIGNVVAVAVGDEEQLRRAQRPHATVPDLDAREPLHLFREDAAHFRATIAIAILKDEDAIPESKVEPLRPLGVGVILRDPQTPARIPRQADGILHLRLGRKHAHGKPRRQLKARRGIHGRQEDRIRVRLAVVRCGERGGHRRGRTGKQRVQRDEKKLHRRHVQQTGSAPPGQAGITHQEMRASCGRVEGRRRGDDGLRSGSGSGLLGGCCLGGEDYFAGLAAGTAALRSRACTGFDVKSAAKK